MKKQEANELKVQMGFYTRMLDWQKHRLKKRLELADFGRMWTLQDDIETGGSEEASVRLREQFAMPGVIG